MISSRRTSFLNHLIRVVSLIKYNIKFVSSSTGLFSNRALILLYSEMISLHLDLYTIFPESTSLLDWRYFWQSKIHTASTTRLLAGVEAGEPADRKHLVSSVYLNCRLDVHEQSDRKLKHQGCLLVTQTCQTKQKITSSWHQHLHIPPCSLTEQTFLVFA